ncbi:MAG: hypothetical protein ACPG3T_07075 [Pseudomonadales bacterium]
MKKLSRSKRYKRNKTLLLGFAALLAILYGLIFIVGIPARQVFILLSVAVVIVLFLAIAGFLFTFSLLALRRLIKNNND